MKQNFLSKRKAFYDNEKQPQSQEQINMLPVFKEYKGSI